MGKINGGYTLVPHRWWCELSTKLSAREISLREAKANFALLEMRAIRRAASAVRAKKRKGQLASRLTANELGRLAGVRASRTLLKRASETDPASEKGRLVPIPRRLLRYLARSTRRSLTLTLLTYIERGLSLRNGVIKNAGTAKASLISAQTGLSLRAVRLARATLLREKILTPDTTRFQRKLNRDGAYFTVNLSWKPAIVHQPTLVVKRTGEGYGRTVAPRKLSPPPAISPIKFARPVETRSPSKELRNQKPEHVAFILSGVLKQNFQATQDRGSNQSPPTLRSIALRDLQDFQRCTALYEQACEARWLRECDASRLRWFSAAIRARSSGARDPVRVFVAIVRKGMWNHITNEQEERARSILHRYDGRLGLSHLKEYVSGG